MLWKIGKIFHKGNFKPIVSFLEMDEDSKHHYVGITQGDLGIVQVGKCEEVLGLYTENLKTCFAVLIKFEKNDTLLICLWHTDHSLSLKEFSTTFDQCTVKEITVFQNEDYKDHKDAVSNRNTGEITQS